MDLFCEIPCLVDESSILNGLELCNRWFKKADKTHPSEALRKFVAYNLQQFKFLEVTPSIVGTDDRCGIAFRTSRYVGAIPLRAPDTGKQIGDFVVAPRFADRERFEDYIEILDLLGHAISPEVAGSLLLASGRNSRPPFYFEAVKFVVALEQMLRKPWRKFDFVEVVRPEPIGQVNWSSYVERESRGENKLRFPVRQNVLSEFHREFRQIRFVFDICSKELRSSNVPLRIRATFRSRLAFLERRLYLHTPLAASSFSVKASDRPAVKDCKIQANKILNSKYSDSTAWRVDFNYVFARFVHHIFEKVAHSIGGKLTINSRLQNTASSYYGGNAQQVRDYAVLTLNEIVAFIDAKYKSHLFNKFESSELLNDEFRGDIQKVLANASLAGTDRGIAVICYPSEQVEIRTTHLENPLDSALKDVLIIGIPMKRTVIPDAVLRIAGEIDNIRGSFQNNS